MEVLKSHNNIVEDRGVYSILEIIDITTGERTILKEFNELIEAPNWMNNGKELIYNSQGNIYKYEIETGVIKQIDIGFCNNCNNDHVLSKDNSLLIVSHSTYEDGHSRVYTIPIQGGNPTLITPIGPSYLHGISPNGQILAYCAERNGQYNIYTIGINGGVETQLTNAEGLDDGPEYSPCGKYIWFNSSRTGLMQIWRMNADGSEQTQITFDKSNSWFPHISPDGNTFSYITYKKGDVKPGKHPANKNVEFRLMSSDGGEYTVLTKLFGGQGSLNVNSWSPDSKKFAFVSYRLR